MTILLMSVLNLGIRVWELATGQEIASFPLPDGFDTRWDRIVWNRGGSDHSSMLVLKPKEVKLLLVSHALHAVDIELSISGEEVLVDPPLGDKFVDLDP